MKRQGLTKHQQQSQSASHPSSGWLQRAAVRSVPEKQVNSDLDRASGLNRSFVNVPVGGNGLPVVQPKLTIGAVGDKYEQQADRVARQVVSQINAPGAGVSSQGETVQSGEGKEIQTKQENQRLQRDEETVVDLQLKPLVLRRKAIGGGAASPELESALSRARGGGQPLDAGLQRSMGQAMGADFSRVKIHTDRQSDTLNRSLQARAFTTGNHIFFKRGEYNPSHKGGQELIAHELTHVVQQGGSTASISEGQTIQRTVVTLPVHDDEVNAGRRIYGPNDNYHQDVNLDWWVDIETADYPHMLGTGITTYTQDITANRGRDLGAGYAAHQGDGSARVFGPDPDFGASIGWHYGNKMFTFSAIRGGILALNRAQFLGNRMRETSPQHISSHDPNQQLQGAHAHVYNANQAQLERYLRQVINRCAQDRACIPPHMAANKAQEIRNYFGV
ncbi:DUF4157 domain-containing protein [Moorena sp. SIO3I6]|uniref:eCIS core domain-containing protein n=1 Tax=Moorena sp. SIO3I6 TaxID=2607831 RepID=UPI0013FC177F|nr:DUF4157 domain-containing protein [Moorena sp. SIO3I6]NEP23434.1 DUF4157 domain-containing protein [Moorena sp. SIO3I6]